MKQRNILIFTTLVVISIICIILTNYNKNDVVIENKKVKNYYTNSISMNFETEAGSGIYEEVKNNDWPLKGYKFNSLLSKCERGSEIIWDSVNKRVQVSSITSDKCYVYFDKVILPSVKVTSSSSTASNITINVTGTKGTYNIAKYMYSIDNKKTWTTKTTSATTSNNTFSSLASNTEYTIYIKIVDAENNESEISTKVRTGVTGAQKIKNLYTSQGANGIYYHNSSLTNGAGDNSYRYAGANPNNWVCFGTDATACDNEHLYRIIGVFGNNIKLIKAYEGTQSSLGAEGTGYNALKGNNYKGKFSSAPAYYWSGSKKNSSNEWANSTLNTEVLNGTYLTTLGTKWSNMIATATWKVGGNDYENIQGFYASITYKGEVVNPAEDTVVNAKVGLMYVSDYGFATLSEYWSTYLENYNSTNVLTNNWLFLGINEWTITRESDNSPSVHLISNTGKSGNNSVVNVYQALRPCFYLESSVGITSGTGTETNPYRVA